MEVDRREQPARAVARERMGGWLMRAGAVYWVAFCCYYLAGVGSDASRTAWTDFAYLPVDLGASVAAMLVAGRPRLEPGTRRAWRLLALAFAARLCGDGSWWWLEAVRHQDPFPSVADAFLLLFVPLLLAGLLSLPVRARSRAAWLRLSLDIAIVVIGAFMVVWYLVLGPTTQIGAETPLATLLSIAYPACDLVILFGVVTVLARGVPLTVRGSIWLLAAGIVCYVLGDLGFSYASLHGGFTGGSWPDLAFIGADCLYLIAGGWQLRATDRQAAGDLPSGRMTQPSTLLPYMGVALGYGLIMWAGRDQSPYGLGGLLVAGVVITFLVLMRQSITSRENQRLAEKFEQLAVTDPMTGLNNRRRLFQLADDELQHAQSTGRPVSVLIIDVDHFKQINDRFGHAAGDAVIGHVADRIRGSVRAQDTVARYGGDEFVVLMPGLNGDAALAVTRRLATQVCAAPISTAAGDITITLSIGLADLTDSTGIEQLLARADAALYTIKNSGRNGIHLATPA